MPRSPSMRRIVAPPCTRSLVLRHNRLAHPHLRALLKPGLSVLPACHYLCVTLGHVREVVIRVGGVAGALRGAFEGDVLCEVWEGEHVAVFVERADVVVGAAVGGAVAAGGAGGGGRGLGCGVALGLDAALGLSYATLRCGIGHGGVLLRACRIWVRVFDGEAVLLFRSAAAAATDVAAYDAGVKS